jgi:hypothetical protein
MTDALKWLLTTLAVVVRLRVRRNRAQWMTRVRRSSLVPRPIHRIFVKVLLRWIACEIRSRTSSPGLKTDRRGLCMWYALTHKRLYCVNLNACLALQGTDSPAAQLQRRRWIKEGTPIPELPVLTSSSAELPHSLDDCSDDDLADQEDAAPVISIDESPKRLTFHEAQALLASRLPLASDEIAAARSDSVSCAPCDESANNGSPESSPRTPIADAAQQPESPVEEALPGTDVSMDSTLQLDQLVSHHQNPPPLADGIDDVPQAAEVEAITRSLLDAAYAAASLRDRLRTTTMRLSSSVAPGATSSLTLATQSLSSVEQSIREASRFLFEAQPQESNQEDLLVQYSERLLNMVRQSLRLPN